VLHWWETRYHDALDLYDHSIALNKFIKGIDWPRQGFSSTTLPVMSTKPSGERVDFELPVVIAWNNKPTYYSIDGPNVWTFEASSIVSSKETAAEKQRLANDGDRRLKASSLTGLVYAPGSGLQGSNMTLRINCKVPSKAMFQISSCSIDGAQGTLLLNGEIVSEFSFKDKDGKNNPYAKELGEFIVVELPVGDNTVVLNNTGIGWFAFDSFSIKDYISANELSNADVYVLKGDVLNILWFKNSRNTWYLHSLGEPLDTIDDIYVELPVNTDGIFRVEWWNTYTGKIVEKEELQSKDGNLKLDPPAFDKDIACKVYGRNE
jgi:hypothetical protein